MKTGITIEINPLFKAALDLMENTSRHVFITGRAGTGKSTLLDYFRNNTARKVAVLAPTGVAALNVKGQTVHSFCRFRPDITLDTVRKLSEGKKLLYRKLDAIIIDEISMVRADLLDCVEKFLRLNGPDSKKIFGGIQMIFIGDLYQLPPVVTSEEKGIFSSRYTSPYFFSARILQDSGFRMEFIELEKIYRQTEKDFITLLNAIRNRSISEKELSRLNKRFDPDFVPPDDEFYITLTSTNDLAFKRNKEKLATLPGKTRRYQGFLEGEFQRSSLPTDEILELKTGAQVMMVNNDPKGRWVNGSIGKIAGIDKKGAGDDILLVELQNGQTVDVYPWMWEIFRYVYDVQSEKLYTEPTGSFTQYPLKLAWAITIHKSQGKTFDKVIIDVGRGTFAHGQVYVALSRCTSFEGIVLKKLIKKGHIRMDYMVIKFLTNYKYDRAEEKMTYDEKRELILDAIRRRKKLDIVYLKPDDTRSRRRIRPESIEMMTYGGKDFEGVVAYCLKRKDIRHFRIERMLEVREV
ncbi:MAG: AAA family ATPase [Candidatus Aminicenantes bacterium]|nr:AAA family ATPase [Candidatus Aminicenantes bacterium]